MAYRLKPDRGPGKISNMVAKFKMAANAAINQA